MSTERRPESFHFKYEFDWQVNPFPGLFVVVEGLDGSGNSTQVQQLKDGFFSDWVGLSEKHILTEKEPTYGPWGAPVNYALRRKLRVDDRTLQLGFTTDRSDHLVQGGLIDHLRTEGNVVLMDRYLASTVAYGYAMGIDMNYLIALQSKFILPDFMFFIDTPVGECLRRIESRKAGRRLSSVEMGKILTENDRYEEEESLSKARDGYLEFDKKFPGLMYKIKGDLTVWEVYDQIVSVMKSHPKT